MFERLRGIGTPFSSPISLPGVRLRSPGRTESERREELRNSSVLCERLPSTGTSCEKGWGLAASFSVSPFSEYLPDFQPRLAQRGFFLSQSVSYLTLTVLAAGAAHAPNVRLEVLGLFAGGPPRPPRRGLLSSLCGRIAPSHD